MKKTPKQTDSLIFIWKRRPSPSGTRNNTSCPVSAETRVVNASLRFDDMTMYKLRHRGVMHKKLSSDLSTK